MKRNIIAFCIFCLCTGSLAACNDFDNPAIPDDEAPEVTPAPVPPAIDPSWNLVQMPDEGGQNPRVLVYKDKKYDALFTRTPFQPSVRVTILNIKEKLEMQAKNEFAAANMELLEEQERLSVMLQENAALQEEGRKLRQKESLSIRDIADNSLSVSLMKEKMKRQALAIHRAEQKVEKKRKAMTDLMQERKTQEVLRDKAFEVFQQEEKAEEGKQIDQLTSYTYGQKAKKEESR